MRNCEIGKSNTLIQYDHIYLKAQENSPCNGAENISIIVHQTKSKKRKKYKIIKCAQQTKFMSRLSRSSSWRNHRSVTKHSSMPRLQNKEYQVQPQPKKSDSAVQTVSNPFQSKYVVNLVSEYPNQERLNPFYNPHIQPRLKMYRCQLTTADDGCCCSCNSDAMFEVMKSLYDCYKKKNCDNCNCILCGHMPHEERRLGEARKSGAEGGVGPEAAKEMKKKKKILKKAEKAMEGKTIAEKEKIMRDLIKSRVPLPEPKTPSEKDLVKRLKTEYGLLSEPKTHSEKEKYKKAEAAGLITPLSGKTPSEKEKILKKQVEMGIPLPEGRTPSEKALIEKVKATTKAPSTKIPSEKWRKAKAEGLLTPIEGKPPEQKEKILRGLAMQGLPLPEGKTDSDRKLIERVRVDLGLPPEPKSRSMKEKYNKAGNAGLMVPLEGKLPSQKEEILQALADRGIPLPEGRTPSEKALIEKVKARTPSTVVTPSQKLRKAKAAGLLTPLAGKTPEQKENIIRGLAEQGIPLPEGKTASEKQLIDKVRAEMGLPPEPKTPSMREKYNKAADAGLMLPLEGKSRQQKEKILQGLADMGIPLPEGRTSSEKSVIAKVKARARPPSEGRPTLSKKIKKAKSAGLLTPLEGKPPEQKENILRGLAMEGLPLPEPKTASEKKLVKKVRAELGLPPEPKSASVKEKYKKAIEAGIITPLEGKSPSHKERILRGQHEMGLPLPEGRTPSEKALIKQIKAVGVASALPPEQRKKLDAKTAKNVKEGTGPVDECICGLLTPDSERDAVLPGRITSGKLREAKAAGLLTPLEGKSPAQKEKILKGLAKRGLPLPEGKTASDNQIIDKVRKDLGLPPEPKTMSMKQKYAQAQEAGLITPLEGKSPSQKERILKGQAEMGLPLPEGRTASEKAIIGKIRATGPDITSEKLRKAKAAGFLTPLEGKSPEEKERILKGLAKTGLPLPEGKTPSEKALISKIKTAAGIPEETVSAKMRKAKAAGILTPLQGKTNSQKEKILRGRAAAGLPLPEGKTPSEKELVKKIKDDTGYVTPTQSERMKRAKAAGLMTPLEGKTPSQKAQIIKGRLAVGLPPPEGKTPSEKEMIRQITAGVGAPPERKSPSAKMRQAKAAGLLTPLEGKTPEQKENILRGLVKVGVPLPEPKTASEKDLINKIRQETGLPPEPKTPSLREKYKKAQAAGIITPLEDKTPSQKERVLKKMHDTGIPLPEGRTASEKALIQRVKAGLVPSEGKIPSEKLRAAKAAGLLTPLEGKTPEQKEKILKGLAKAGIPLPVAKTTSEKALIKKVRNELGLPPEPQTASIKERMKKAQAAGLITPLEGKSPSQKERILRNLAEAGVPLPEGRTASEKAMISKVQAETRRPSQIRGPPALPPEQARKLDEKTAKVMKEGKGPADECICGLLTPESERPTEKISGKALSEKLRKAKAAGLLTPLKGKSPEEKERILIGLAQQGLPLPEPQTASEKKLVEKVRKDLGLPPEPDTVSDRKRYEKAVAAGKMVPLEGKSPSEKVKILKSLAAMGVPLPEGRTPSEKALIDKVRAEAKPIRIPSEKWRQAKAAGLLTPLEGKTPEQKEKIMRGLAMQGLPIPEPKTESDKKLAEKVRAELGLPPEPTTPSERRRYEEALAAGKMVPLEGKTPSEKVKILKSLAAMGVPLPEGRTSSEKALIAKLRAEGVGVRGAGAPPLPPEKARKLDEKTAKVMKEGKGPADECICDLLTPESERVSKATMKPVKLPSEKLRKAKAAGLLTPLEGKTAERKEEIMRGLAMQGLPIPEPRTASERKLAEKVRAELGLPPEPKTPSERRRYEEGIAAGKIVPLEGKTASEKVKILKNQATIGLPLPEGRTASEKALIAKVRAETKVKIPSEKLRKAKAAGLLTPLEGKTAAQQEKILKGLAIAGLPLPEPKTESERQSIEKVRTELGLPPEPKTPEERRKYEEGVAAGIIAPLEGKTAAEKATILRGQAEAGIPLPEGRTRSEKALIAQIKSESKKASKVRIPSEKIRKAKAAGLLTPLEGKSEAQKEKILRGLAMQGLPLPEGQTASERKLIDKVRRDLGLPPEPKTASEKRRYEKAIASGVIVPLENLSSSMKEKTLRAQAELGLPLPEGRTASEKALIAKVIAESKSPHKVSSEKLRKAKAAGLMTPLEGKSAAQKEKIIRGLAETGMPLPEGKTPSEKSMLHKIRTELGIPPPAITASEKELIREAKAEGLFTPLAGKSKAQKEKIIKGLAEAGLPIPEGKIASEKALIKKIRIASGLPPEATPSERKGGLKTKSKRIGVRALKSTKGIGARRTKVEGISEEYEDIVKTTTCDRGCGCDRKKIRFKHSYVKIKVTSPDISSLCPCPDECIPGVKGGIFTDNEGIKVTIGRAIGVPSCYRKLSLINSSSEELVFDMGPDYKPADSGTFFNNSNTKYTKNNNTKIPNKLCEDRVSSNESFGTKPSKDTSQNSISYLYNSMLQSNYNYWMNESDMYLGALCRDPAAYRRRESLSSLSVSSSDCTNACSEFSFDTLVIIKSETSLRLTTSSCSSLRISSILSFVDNDFTSNPSQYLCHPLAESSNSNTAVHESDYFADIDRKTREEYLFKHRLNTDKKLVSVNQNQNRYEILRMTQSKFRRDHAMGNIEPVILINDVNSDHDIMTMMDELLSSREFSGTSSIYVVVSGSDSSELETKDSAICLHTPEKKLKLTSSIHLKQRISSIACALKISTTPKSKYYESYASPQYCKPDINRLLETSQNIKPEVKQPQELLQTKQPDVKIPKETLQTIKPDNLLQNNQSLQPLEKNTTSQPKHTSQKKDLLNRLYQITVPKKKKQIIPNIVSTDTTQDRPCCCSAKERESIHVLPKYSKNIQCAASVVSELITPMIMKQGISQGIPMQDLGFPTQTSFSRHNYLPDSPVIMCEIPPCVGSQCHYEGGRHRQLATSDPCPPGQVKFAPTLNSGQQRSVGCGSSDTKPGVNPTKKNAICPPCKNQESKIDKNSQGNKKKVKLKPPCASDPHHPPLSRAKPAAKVATRSIGCQCCRCADAQTGTEQPIRSEVNLCTEPKIDIKNEKCFCKNKPGKKNKVVCECPEVDPEMDYIAYEIDAKDKWKMQSELTQTTSGFKVDLKKHEVDSEMSFEDALAYYASLEMDTGAADFKKDADCQCENSKKKKKKKSFECLCPEVPLVPEPIPAEPFKGFKFTIGGKGSASKGLSGVCCFDMYESNTYMVAYLDEMKTISRSSLSS